MVFILPQRQEDPVLGEEEGEGEENAGGGGKEKAKAKASRAAAKKVVEAPSADDAKEGGDAGEDLMESNDDFRNRMAVIKANSRYSIGLFWYSSFILEILNFP